MSIPVMFNADCLDALTRLSTGSVDMILTDLPYGTTACKWDVVIPFAPLWEQFKRVLKPNGATVLFGSEPFSSHLRLSNLADYRYDWIWDKVTARGHLVAKKRSMQQSECISVFYSRAPTYNPQMIKRPPNKIEKRRDEGTRSEIIKGSGRHSPRIVTGIYDHWYPKTILSFSNAGSGRISVHPTQKPVELTRYLIRTYSNPGETVLDATMGSGTTGVAALREGRQFIGIERDPHYFLTAQMRVLSEVT